MAFTIDGPRGPRHVVKPGPVTLARSTGIPMVVFHIALHDPWVLNTWDRLMIPKPFSRGLVRVSCLIPVPEDADEAQMQRAQDELQATLDQARIFTEENVRKVGTAEFPFFDRKIGPPVEREKL